MKIKSRVLSVDDLHPGEKFWRNGEACIQTEEGTYNLRTGSKMVVSYADSLTVEVEWPRFADLNVGDTFLYNSELYMKVGTSRMLHLDHGVFEEIIPELEIAPIDAQVVR